MSDRPVVLAVDDRALNLELVQAYLAEVQKDMPDLMILDVYMPGIDGFEVCRRLREDPATQSLPIVMLSSRGNIKEKLAGFRAGADDYLVKEFDLLDLPYRVRLVFRLRGLDEDNGTSPSKN